MVGKYIRTSSQSAPKNKHAHVLLNRSKMNDDGSMLVTESLDDSPFEAAARKAERTGIPAPTLTEIINAGEKPKKIGSLGSIAVLDDAIFAQSWLNRFNAAANVPQPMDSPVSRETPSVNVEPSNNE